jgi:hypothetical protein
MGEGERSDRLPCGQIPTLAPGSAGVSPKTSFRPSSLTLKAAQTLTMRLENGDHPGA